MDWFSCNESRRSKSNRKRKASEEIENPSKRVRLNNGYEGGDEESDYDLVRT